MALLDVPGDKEYSLNGKVKYGRNYQTQFGG